MEARAPGQRKTSAPDHRPLPVDHTGSRCLCPKAKCLPRSLERRSTAGLTCGDVESQGSCTTVAGEMDFRAPPPRERPSAWSSGSARLGTPSTRRTNRSPSSAPAAATRRRPSSRRLNTTKGPPVSKAGGPFRVPKGPWHRNVGGREERRRHRSNHPLADTGSLLVSSLSLPRTILAGRSCTAGSAASPGSTLSRTATACCTALHGCPMGAEPCRGGAPTPVAGAPPRPTTWCRSSSA